jgi:RimJ/RimL family protein N-acetyltransferase
MDKQHQFEERVHQTWADYWECEPAFFSQPGTSLRPRKSQGDSAGIHIWTNQCRAFIGCDPSQAEQLQEIIEALPGDLAASAETIAHGWPSQEIDTITIGLLFHLFPDDLCECHLPGGFALRRLTDTDSDQLRLLEGSNSPEDVSEAYIAANHEMVCGVFQLKGQGETPRLVTAASAYEYAGFVDPGVLTHPDFRGRGFGSAAIHALCQWAIRQDRLMQYRCNQDNTASHHMAQRLGFTQYSTQESIWLR